MSSTPLVLLLASLAQVAAIPQCADGAGSAACPSSESVLLQRAYQHPSLLSKTRSQTLTCETCVEVFDQLGGCDSLMNDDRVAVADLHSRPELGGCAELVGCEARMHDNCGAPTTHVAIVTCQTCVDSFDQLGGCDSLRNDDQVAIDTLLRRPLFAGCEEEGCVPRMHDNCGVTATQSVKLEHPTVICQTCVDSFDQLGGCDSLRNEDQVAIDNLLAQPMFSGCEAQGCVPQMHDNCGAPLTRAAREDSREAEGLCDPACPELYERAGGCTALNEGTFADGMAILEEPSLNHCHLDVCGDTLFERCRPEALPQGFCEECIAKFTADGGCEAVRAAAAPGAQVDDGAINALIPDGCWPCGEESMDHCMPEATADSAPGCHTARKADACFGHVRWALERGVALHPDWYDGLTRNSSFEQFQGLFHSRGEHNCPRPCAELPAGYCHTAVAGEECYRHALWAKEVGIRMSPAMYPAGLEPDASVTAFQAWLHHIHHGDCQAPCDP